jgi:hypothetical protein
MKLLLDQLDHLLALFTPLCKEKETLVELRALLPHEKEWPKAHYLAMRVRAKNLASIKLGKAKSEAQYAFEEVCAQTLHNMSASKQPFSADTPYWIIPLALKLARVLEIDSKKILEIVIS